MSSASASRDLPFGIGAHDVAEPVLAESISPSISFRRMRSVSSSMRTETPSTVLYGSSTR